MQGFRRFLGWFSKQRLIARLGISCVGLLAFCCLCSIPASILGSGEPTATATAGFALPVLPSAAASEAGESSAATAPTPTSTLAASPTAFVVPSATVAADLLPAEVSPTGSLQFHFINVGQGDATLIQTPGGKVMLVDGGDPDTGIVPYLQSLGVNRIDMMVATHPNADHIGGLVQVLGSFPVAKVITNGQMVETSTYERFLDGISAAHAEYGEVKRGSVFSLDGIEFRVLNPAGSSSDPNENSIVLQFTYSKTTFLMMGDSGAETEAALLSAGIPLKADIFKVGHHGSASGSTVAFLSAVQPNVALYSAAINNQYGLPAPQTIAALKEVGAAVYGTDKDGTINIDVDQNGYTMNATGVQVVRSPILPTVTHDVLPTPASTGLEIVSVTSPVARGANARLVAKTAPNASCSITVYYKSGPSSAAGLDPKTADSGGNISWTWKVGSRTTPGSWRIVVTCNGISKETTHTVQ